MAKAPKETTFLVSSAGTGYVYINRKNKKKLKGEKKMSLKKYDPIARKKVLFEEKKPSRLKKKYHLGAENEAPVAKKAKASAEAQTKAS